MLAKHEATAVSHRHVSLSHQLPSLPAERGGNTEPCGAFPGRSHREERKRAACPGARPPQPAHILNAHPILAAGREWGWICSPVCRARGWGAGRRSELTAGDEPVAGAEAVRGAQGAAAALPQPPVAAVVGLAAPAGTPRPPNPPSNTRRAGGGPASNLRGPRRGGGEARAGFGWGAL